MWTNLLYGWMALSTLTTTGEIWYATTPTRWQIRTVDEMEILLGTAERCIAATNGQMTYLASIRWTNGEMQTVTNALTWQLDSRMLNGNDVALKAAVPSYLQTNTIGTTFTPWTYTGLVAELGIEFAAFGHPVRYTNYADRYKALNLLKMTWSNNPTWTNAEYWSGSGEWVTNDTGLAGDGSTNAYNRAVDNYQVRSNGLCAGYTFGQACVKTTWQEVVNVGSNIYQTNLVVTTTSNYLGIVTNGIYFSGGSGIFWTDSELIVSGGSNVSPDVRGQYSYDSGTAYVWKDAGAPTFEINWSYGSKAYIVDFDTSAEWENTALTNPAGVFLPFNEFASGILTVTVGGVTSQLASAGLYTPVGGETNIYTLDGWFIHYGAGSYWTCATDTNLPSSGEYYLESFGADVEPDWVLLSYQTIYELVAATGAWAYAYSNNPVDPSGTYTPRTDFESYPAWTQDVWSVVYSNSSYYITTNTDALSPAWTLETGQAGADSPGLTYSNIIGSGITGTATVVYQYLTEPAYQTNRHFGATLFKLGADYAITNLNTNIAHGVEGWYFLPSAPSGYSTNIFDSQGLGYSNAVWTNLFTAGADHTNQHTVNVGGDLSTAPNESPTCTNLGQTTAQGFYINENKVVSDWIFLYATNKYW